MNGLNQSFTNNPYELIAYKQCHQQQKIIKYLISFYIIHNQYEMITQVNPEKQLVESVFRATMLTKINAGKPNKKTIQKNTQIAIQRLVHKFNILTSQLNQNKNLVGEHCLSLMQKRKVGKIGETTGPALFSLERISLRQEKEHENGYFEKKKSEKINSIDYTYLKISSNLYIFNYAFIPEQKADITFVLSQSRIQCIFSYIQLCLHYNQLIRCIMPIPLWQRVGAVYELFWGNSIFQLLSSSNLLLFPEEKTGSFDFENSLVIFSRKFWLWDSFDLYIVIKGSKYLIKGAGIEQNQIIYSAWRSNIVEQSQYCRLIDKTLKSNIVWGESISDRFITFKQEYKHFLSTGTKYFHKFSQCEIFLHLPLQIVKQIYQSGEITQFIQDQIIYKSWNTLDKFFILIEGQLILEKDQNSKINNPVVLKASDYFYLESIIEYIPRLKETLRASGGKSLVFSISLWKLKYLLGHYTEQIKMIFNYTEKLQLTESIRVSRWIQNIIKTDQKKSKNLSEDSTKRLGGQRLKVSKELWKKLCARDLKFLFLTIQQENDTLQ